MNRRLEFEKELNVGMGTRNQIIIAQAVCSKSVAESEQLLLSVVNQTLP